MPDTSELIGRVFDNRYKIVELIGRGGMGAVYKAIHVSMNQVVALKVLGKGMSNDDRQVQRFYQEAKASSRLKHPNTIKVFDFGRAEDGHLYLAMEFLEGVTLTNLLRQEKVLSVRRAIHIAKQVARSLGEAHLNQLVHRDLKPDNIFICRVYGEEDFVKVLDFGIAKFQEGDPEHENLTQAGLVCGTPLYMSPEQGLGRSLDGRSDLYSLGVILYEMVSGRPPFRADTPIALVMRHIHDRPPSMSDHNPGLAIPDALHDLIYGLLEKDREKRTATSEDLFKVMDAIVNAGGFPEEPSKEVVDVPQSRAAGSKTRVESVDGAGVDHEESTRFIGQADEAPVDADAPTSFMSRDSGSVVRGTGPQRVRVPTGPQAVQQDRTQALPLEGFSSTGNVRASTRDVPSQGGSRGWLWVIVSLVVLGIATAAGGYVLGWFVIGDGTGGGSEASASNTVPQPNKAGSQSSVVDPPPVEPKTLKARIVTVPAGAAVEQGGKGVGTTPMEVTLKEGDPPLSYLLKAPGYRDRTVTITPAEAIAKGETTLKYELEKAEDVAAPVKGNDAALKKTEPVPPGAATPVKKDDKPKTIKKIKPKLNWGE